MFLLRTLEPRDYDDILRAEARAEYPWCEDDLKGLLKKPDHFGVVVDINDRVSGYCVYKKLAHGIFILNIVSIYPRLGIGRFMINELLEKAKRISLYVRETNLEAQLFFREVGFKAIKVAAGHYEYEDGYLFTLHKSERVHS